MASPFDRKTVILFILIALGIFLLVLLPFFIIRHPPAAPAGETVQTQPGAEHSESAAPAAEARSGVFRSDDGGNTWAPKVSIGAGANTIAGIAANDLVVNARDPNSLYLATKARGLWVSYDRGESWGRARDSNAGLRPDADIEAVGLDPRDFKTWYVAAFQQNRGHVFKTEDGGFSFRDAYVLGADRFGIFDANVIAPGDVHIVTGEGGYLESADGGGTWRVVRWFQDGLLRLRADPRNSSVRYILSAQGRLFKTADGGSTWSDISPAFRQFSGAGENQSVRVTPSGALYLGSRYGLLRSDDDGASFHPVPLIVPPDALPVSAPAIDPQNERHLISAGNAELYESKDGGETWAVMAAPGTGRVSKVVFDPKNSRTLYALVQP